MRIIYNFITLTVFSFGVLTAVTDEEFRAVVDRLAKVETRLADVLAKDEVRAQECVAQHEAIRTLENRLDKQEKTITMLLSYLGHGGSDGNNSAYEEHIPDGVDINELIKKNENRSSIARRQVLVEGHVAFFATNQASQGNLGINQNIIFEDVSLNLGNAYRPGHGLFIVPRAGIYMFSATLLTKHINTEEVHAAITVNGNIVAALFGEPDAGGYDQSTQTVILNLKVNDEVFVRNIHYSNEYVYGGAYSSFSGVLLYDI